jgi:pimeloyl-ACP methyl ester carboxylesterase
MAKKTMAMAGSSFEILEGQSRSFHELPSGLKMEVIQQLAQHTNKPDGNLKKEKNPPIVFLHGSYHAAWCWAIHWLPFFSTKGHDCYALSFLGQV